MEIRPLQIMDELFRSKCNAAAAVQHFALCQVDYALLPLQNEELESRIDHGKRHTTHYTHMLFRPTPPTAANHVRHFVSFLQRRREDRENRYTNVMRSLVWRYVTSMQRRCDDDVVTEDDINEVKSDISSMRYEMLAIFEKNGMDVSCAEKRDKSHHAAKRMKIWERRLMKNFHVAPTINEDEVPQQSTEKGIERFRRVAKQVMDQTSSHKWSEAVRRVQDTQIGRCHDRDSFRNQQNLAKAISEAKRLIQHSPAHSRAYTPVEYDDPTANTLMQLLQNISEEIDQHSPANTVRSSKGRGRTLGQQLQTFIASRSPSPLPSNIVQLAENLSVLERDPRHRHSIVSHTSADRSHQARSASRAPSPDTVLTVEQTYDTRSHANRTSISMHSPPPPIIHITSAEAVCRVAASNGKSNDRTTICPRFP